MYIKKRMVIKSLTANVDVKDPIPAMSVPEVAISIGVRTLPINDQCCVYKNCTFAL